VLRFELYIALRCCFYSLPVIMVMSRASTLLLLSALLLAVLLPCVSAKSLKPPQLSTHTHSSGSGSYNPPADALYLRLRMVGAGTTKLNSLV
jgi:hypothetical protein